MLYTVYIYIINSVDWVSATPSVNNLNAMTLSLFFIFFALILHVSYTLCFIFQYACVSVNIIRIWSQKPILQVHKYHSKTLSRSHMWNRRYLIKFSFVFHFWKKKKKNEEKYQRNMCFTHRANNKLTAM